MAGPSPPGPDVPLRVLFVLSYPRSGSTILGRTLATADDVFFAGEVRYLWAHRLEETKRCSCGVPVRECPFWSAVASALNDADALRLQRRAVTSSRAWMHAGRGVPARARPYADLLRQAYADVQGRSGATLVVDSSKWPTDAAVASRLHDGDVSVLHLVRDPRKVVFSRQRKALKNGRRPGLLRTAYDALGWTMLNVGAELLRRRVPADRWLRIRFEDFVAAPDKALDALWPIVGRANPSLALNGRDVVLERGHIVAGNRQKFASGSVPLVEDDQWRTELPRPSARLVRLLTIYPRRWYGY